MAPVQLYVYDLSNGLARRLSLQFTGKQIDGIWHTSVVVFGKEIFYGQGILTTLPGRSHHGRPLQVVDMGQTEIDEETFQEYLSEIREHYTADKYHLLDFNCNSFTNDVIGFLTGGSIPSWIKDLPADFLSTPFGAALRPTIDSMFRRPTPGAPVPTPPTPVTPSSASGSSSPPNPQLTASLLQAVAAQAASNAPTRPVASTAISAPIHIATNPTSFHSLLRSHRTLVAFFTSATCPPCKMIEPVFEDLAKEKSQGRPAGSVAFVKIDMGVGLGGQVASEYGVRVTPTFIFFLNEKKMSEMKGADAPELRSQVDLLLFEAFPPHPHTSLSLPAVQSLSMNPILFTQVPALDTVLAKFNSFIDASTTWPTNPPKTQVKDTLTNLFLPYLKARFGKEKTATPSHSQPGLLSTWAHVTAIVAESLPPAQLFPLVDMWRLAFLDEATGNWAASLDPSSTDPIRLFLARASASTNESITDIPRNYLLTVLRMLSNTFATVTLSRRLLAGNSSSLREMLTSFLVATLLHGDVAVRTAAASVAFNVAAYLQKVRVEKVKSGVGVSSADEAGDADWEVEMVSAVVEAIGREKESEDVVHRLTASLAFLVRLSPLYDEHLSPLLEVLQARDVLKGKLVRDGCGALGVQKKDVRNLVTEVADKLCP
ncbi:hypothetical protein JAAARDRAFT_189616 [Jaapia argillacea MUCL 33604]|uniref:PPPDE domain-containing protein n=1 Tax=Jaapia argillacea MUCL 33604 TaxID=933084 RepID=A0A067Q5K8_9AGAM|nr:hypothetical protein JAAARDRAFT_189616 [Jaapia argillacea MUCL 33604]